MFEVCLVNGDRLQIDGTRVRWEQDRVEIFTESVDPTTRERRGLDELMFAAPIGGVLAIRKVELTKGSVGNA